LTLPEGKEVAMAIMARLYHMSTGCSVYLWRMWLPALGLAP